MRPPSDLPRGTGLSRFGRRTRNLLVALVAVLALSIVVGRWLARLVTDSWWFDSILQRDVLATISLVRVELGIVSGLAAACLLYGCLLVVDRTAPLEPIHDHDDQLVARYQVLVAEHGLALRIIASVVFGGVAALPVVARWQQWLLFRHAMPFSGVDDVYGRNLSFYVFRLPFITFACDWLFTLLVVATLVSAAAHYLSGSMRLALPRRAAAGVRVHLSVLFIALALLRASAYWLHRYRLVTSTRGFVRGVGYVDEHHVRPALELLCLIALITAALVLVGWRQRSWRLPVASAAVWAVVSVTAGAMYPAVMQRLLTNDGTARKEHDGIVRNVAATRDAFGLDPTHLSTVVVDDPTVSSPDDLANLADVRLLSPRAAVLTLPPSRSLPDVTAAVVNDRLEQIYVGVPAAASAPGDSWAGQHRLVLTPTSPAFVRASAVAAGGRAADVPAARRVDASAGPILIDDAAQPYGVLSGADRDRTPDGLASVDLSSFGRRLAFALRFGDLDLVRKTTNRDQILYERSVTDRVRTLAPFLAWDSDPYPVIVAGRLQWIVDGYTTTDDYPSAQRADVRALPGTSGLRRSFNYVRNSVKAVVDAHTGAVSLYTFDESDPLLKAWSAVFPSLFAPRAAMKQEVVDHLRYPLDLLTVQATTWGVYRDDDVQGDEASYFVSPDGKWMPAPVAVQGLANVSSASGSVTTATTAKERTTTTSTGSARSRVVEPAYAMWNSELVAVAPMVSPSSGSTRLAALVTGTVDDRGVPSLTVYRTDTDVASPAVARAAIELEVRKLAPNLPETSFGELQAVRVGDGVAWVLPWYKPATAQLNGVGLLAAGGTVRLGNTIEGAVRAAYWTDPGFTTVEGAEATPGGGPGVPPDFTPAELQAAARELYRQAQEQLDAGDVRGAYATLDRAYQYLRKAAESAAVTAAPPTSPAPDAPTTSTTVKGWTA